MLFMLQQSIKSLRAVSLCAVNSYVSIYAIVTQYSGPESSVGSGMITQIIYTFIQVKVYISIPIFSYAFIYIRSCYDPSSERLISGS